LTKQCPLNCTHCAVSAWKKWPMELSDNEWLNVVKQLSLNNFDVFQISWWEPFLRKNLIFDILKKYWNKFKNIVINTNALLIDDDILDYLEKYNVIVYVSIYWSNPDLYKSLTLFDFFSNADKWIKKLMSRNIDVRASVPMVSNYIEHISEINDYIHSLGITRIAYMWLIPAWRAKDNMNILINEKRSDYLPKMYKYCW
jgi:MoaA/NifB/PqqE/SkfB family radical SAM enzyme